MTEIDPRAANFLVEITGPHLSQQIPAGDRAEAYTKAADALALLHPEARMRVRIVAQTPVTVLETTTAAEAAANLRAWAAVPTVDAAALIQRMITTLPPEVLYAAAEALVAGGRPRLAVVGE